MLHLYLSYTKRKTIEIMRLPDYLKLKDRKDIAIEYLNKEFYISLDIEYRLKSGGYLDIMSFQVYDVVYYNEQDEMLEYDFCTAETEKLKELWIEKFEVEAELELEKEYKDYDEYSFR